jgi:phosphoglycolate phosphatase
VNRLFTNAPPAALLFDLDGTLLDSAPDLAQAVDRMLAGLGYAAAGEERVRRWVGNGSRKLVQRALAFARATAETAVDDAAIDEAQRGFMVHYGACCTDRSRLYDGVLPALERWQERALPMACVTNKPAQFTERLLDHFGLRRFLPFAISGDTLATRKPDPAMLLAACARLAVAPARAVMVGDSRNDVLAARAAGMAVVCVSYGYNHGRPVAAEAPDRLVDSLGELV